MTAEGTTLTCRVTGSPDALVKAAARHTITALRADTQDLEELFHTYYGAAPGTG